MTIKQERMMDRVREILSSLLLTEVTDPALKGITVTQVVMDRELEYAKVFVNALGDESRQPEVMAGLKRANGYLRRELGKRLQLRRVPNLHFHWDVSLARAEAMVAKLDQLKRDQPISEPTAEPTSDTPAVSVQPSETPAEHDPTE